HDVVFSFTDAGKEGSRAARAGSFNDASGRGIWGCAAIDDYTFSCDHNPAQLSPEFFYHISNENGLVSISSKNVYDTLGEEQAILTPHGSGPWEVTKQVGNDEMVARAKLDHWRSPPLADSLRIIEIREAPKQQQPSSLVKSTSLRFRARLSSPPSTDRASAAFRSLAVCHRASTSAETSGLTKTIKTTMRSRRAKVTNPTTITHGSAPVRTTRMPTPFARRCHTR
ncbi:MAG: hypothetical protein F4180_08815, partial [Chloroflexi bacterium]|nr:hypothetical protein [Chloroflexota bacterium]